MLLAILPAFGEPAAATGGRMKGRKELKMIVRSSLLLEGLVVGGNSKVRGTTVEREGLRSVTWDLKMRGKIGSLENWFGAGRRKMSDGYLWF